MECRVRVCCAMGSQSPGVISQVKSLYRDIGWFTALLVVLGVLRMSSLPVVVVVFVVVAVVVVLSWWERIVWIWGPRPA